MTLYPLKTFQSNIFGSCATQYIVSSESTNTFHTYKNLRECEVRQIFQKQFSSVLSFIKQVTGGYKEGPISEVP